MNKITALLYIRGGGRVGGFEFSEGLEVTETTTRKEIEEYLAKIQRVGHTEIKIQFPRIIKGTATGGVDWIMGQIQNENNWKQEWICPRCKKKFPTLDNILTDKQMEELNERFPWTCPECYIVRKNSLKD